jgi:ABC-2 type transport system ATP-binding protein
MTESAIEITHLVKDYGKTRAVNDISLSVPQGSFIGLLGPNGAGKSTTINCIMGVNKITGGSIQVLGHDVELNYREARKQVGIAPQEFNVDIFAKVWKILDYVAGYYGLTKSERQKRIPELLEQFSLTEHKDKPFRALSGGLKRRVMLARALVHDPEIVILDEPTAGVDVELRLELWEHLKELHTGGKTILLTSHYLDEVEMLANHFAFIANGKIVAEGPKESFLQDSKTLESVYLELTSSKKRV